MHILVALSDLTLGQLERSVSQLTKDLFLCDSSWQPHWSPELFKLFVYSITSL